MLIKTWTTVMVVAISSTKHQTKSNEYSTVDSKIDVTTNRSLFFWKYTPIYSYCNPPFINFSSKMRNVYSNIITSKQSQSSSLTSEHYFTLLLLPQHPINSAICSFLRTPLCSPREEGINSERALLHKQNMLCLHFTLSPFVGTFRIINF